MDIILLFLAKRLDKHGTTLVHITYPTLDALINTHTVYINSLNVIQGMGRDGIASDQFRFEIARVWFAKCRALNGSCPSIIHMSFKKKS